MGYAYTPGLTVAEHTVVRKVRRLPLAGTVIVRVGQPVNADDVVAETALPGDVREVNVAGKLGIAPDELPRAMLKTEGQHVAAGEVFARTKGLFGLFKSEVAAPIAGTLESVSAITGKVFIRGAPLMLRKSAYARGTVVDVCPGESATVEIRGTFIQGIFGIGGEACGPLAIGVDSPDAVLDEPQIRPDHAGQIVVGGSLLTAAAVHAAIRHGVKGIVTGGLNDAELRSFLGYELGVAITGEETLGLTIVVTEGFGRISMADATFAVLRKRAGMLASINGATQIRAGVIRPEVIVPLVNGERTETAPSPEPILQVGSAVRAIREPHFGRIGRCTALPPELVRLPSETSVRVLEVEFENKERAILPRANVELITH
ncbi:MAG: hypothetical protein AB1716_07975 [Planctomycetota bacterium]